MTIVGFLMQRIAEDEAVARAATQGDWYWEPPSEESFPMSDESLMSTVADDEGGYTSVLVGWGYDASGIEGRNEDRAHITRYQPARALAECAAKRRIVELHYQDVVPGKFDLAEDHACDRGWGDVAYTEDCTTLRSLAAVYSDHPDYRQDWALKRTLEEGDTRRRESLARHEAWSRARAQWHLRVSMAEARRICTSCGQDLGDE